MYKKTIHATHPGSMEGADNQALRDRYLMSGLFAPGEIVLNYTHYERFVIGGAAPTGAPVKLPVQTAPESAKGKPFLERREMGAINVGEGAGSITPDRLDGNLLVGLSPKILGWIPGAQDKVFVEERDGLRWAKVNISGTPTQPKEDLTKRLISAFRDKMTKEFKGQTKDAVKSLLDMLHQ